MSKLVTLSAQRPGDVQVASQLATAENELANALARAGQHEEARRILVTASDRIGGGSSGSIHWKKLFLIRCKLPLSVRLIERASGRCGREYRILQPGHRFLLRSVANGAIRRRFVDASIYAENWLGC